MQPFRTEFTAKKNPEQVFRSILQVRGWWSGEINGDSDTLGAEFTYEVPGVHWSKQRVSVFEPGRKLVWRVTDSRLDFVKTPGEWQGTDIVFELSPVFKDTLLQISHLGLTPRLECFRDCSNAWGLLLHGNLLKFIQTGEAQPSLW